MQGKKCRRNKLRLYRTRGCNPLLYISFQNEKYFLSDEKFNPQKYEFPS